MCGIVGIFPLQKGIARATSTAARVEAAVRALHHRGPDGSGVYIDDNVALGHTRLAILDPTPAGSQPMTSACGRYTIVFNGEIYNFQDLRAELQASGIALRGSSDTEVILECFAREGPSLFKRLNGIFALAIIQRNSGVLTLARDPFGVKPLYLSEGSFGFAFASEIKSLLEIAPIARTIDHVALRRYLTFLWCPGERTLLKEVRKLEPGEVVIVQSGRLVRHEHFAAPMPNAGTPSGSPRHASEALGEAIEAAVQRQMVSDAPVGGFLSGGLDSTAVVAAARKLNPDLACYTIALVGDGASEIGSDLPYARQAAAALGVRLREVEVGPHDVVAGAQRMVADLDEPLADPACLNVLMIAKAARQDGIKVMLSGAGGDDIFSGYRRHQALRFSPLIDATPLGIRQAIAQIARRDGFTRFGFRKLTKVLANIDQSEDGRIAHLFAWATPATVDALLPPPPHEVDPSDAAMAPLMDLLSNRAQAPALERCLALEQRFFLADHNLTYTDKMGMAAGVEVRVPFLDLELARKGAAIPTEWKMRGGVTKWLFRQSQKGRIPPAILTRPKVGFGVPLRTWLRGPLREMSEELLSRRTLQARGLFNAANVASLIADNDAGRVDASYTLFSLMCVELWARRFL